MDEIISAIVKAILSQEGVVGACLLGALAYQTWRVLRSETARDKDRATYRLEAEARTQAFNALSASLVEIRHSIESLAEIKPILLVMLDRLKS